MKISYDILIKIGACLPGMNDDYLPLLGMDEYDVEYNLAAQMLLLSTPLKKHWGYAVYKGWIPAWSMYGANLCGANLERANLCGANLAGANLERANLAGANLYGANLYGANLCGANLERANLAGANLERANLAGANLCGANLGEANLGGASLYGADLRDTILGNRQRCHITKEHIISDDSTNMNAVRRAVKLTNDSFHQWADNQAAEIEKDGVNVHHIDDGTTELRNATTGALLLTINTEDFESAEIDKLIAAINPMTEAGQIEEAGRRG